MPARPHHPPEDTLRDVVARLTAGRVPVWPYLRGALLSVACIWIFVVVYLTWTPRVYASRWVLNLPGAASNVSVSLDSIGQTSSTPNSPFSSSALSPKVVYKEIAESERVRQDAANRLGIELPAFGAPRIKLVDETALMMFEIKARTPEDARRRADALIAAFDAELDRLRNDELEKRDSAVRANIAGYQAQVRLARDNTIKAQHETGLVSTAQFSEMVTTLTNLRRHVVEVGAEAQKLEHEFTGLSERLGVSAREAGVALKLAADSSFQKAVAALAEADAQFTADDARFGPQHPQRFASLMKRDGARERVQQLIDAALPQTGAHLDAAVVVDLANATARADLFATLVRDEAALDGKKQELATLVSEQERLEADVARTSPAAARLEDLKKDQLVADAVLSSALARLDSSKSDIYGSYPIVQVVAPPDQSPAAVQPRPFYAALGGMSGTLFACLAWVLAWLQREYRVTRSKNA